VLGLPFGLSVQEPQNLPCQELTRNEAAPVNHACRQDQTSAPGLERCSPQLLSAYMAAARRTASKVEKDRLQHCCRKRWPWIETLSPCEAPLQETQSRRTVFALFCMAMYYRQHPLTLRDSTDRQAVPRLGPPKLFSRGCLAQLEICPEIVIVSDWLLRTDRPCRGISCVVAPPAGAAACNFQPRDV